MAAEDMKKDLLVEVKDLRIEFDVRAGIVKAVDGLSLDIYRGRTMGVIGESGCGKSMTARQGRRNECNGVHSRDIPEFVL